MEQYLNSQLLVQLFIIVALHSILRRLYTGSQRSTPPPNADSRDPETVKDGTDASATQPADGVSCDIISENRPQYPAPTSEGLREIQDSVVQDTAPDSRGDSPRMEPAAMVLNVIEEPRTGGSNFENIKGGDGGAGGSQRRGGRGGDVNVIQTIYEGPAVLARLKEALQPAEMDASDLQECLDGTRRNVIQPILDWADDVSADANIYWVNGSAGLGKSSVANSIAMERREQRGAYLFFSRNNPSASDPHLVIRTIAYRLAVSNPTIQRAMIKVIEQEPAIATEPLITQFIKLLLEPLSLCQFHLRTPLLIILDALDECGGPETRRGLLDVIVNRLTTLPGQVKFLITSRPESDIAGLFLGCPNITQFELLAATSTTDVRTFLRYSLSSIRECCPQSKLEADWPGTKRFSTLSTYAGGVFIWAATAVRVIRSDYDPEAALEDLLATMSSGDHTLYDLYAATLSGVGQWGNARFVKEFQIILGAVLFGRVPMTAETLDQLLGLKRSSSSILSTLRSLLQYREGHPVVTLHASISDYLTDHGRCGEQRWFIDEATHQEHLLSCCFRLMKGSLRFNICDIETSYLLNEEIPGLPQRIQERIPACLRYACKHFADHLSQVEPSGTDALKDVDLFMRVQLLFWLEVLGLVGEVGLAILAMMKLGQWCQNRNKELTDLASEVIKFTNIFRNIISQSTSHLYISAVPMWRQESHLRHLYDSKFKAVARVEGDGADSAPSLQRVMRGHTLNVSSVAFSPDGKRIVSGSGDATVRVWDAETGSPVTGPFKGHTFQVTSVAFSPDGKHIVSGSGDKTVRVWDAETGSPVTGPFKGHTSVVRSVAFSPDGKHIVSGSDDKTVRVWDAEIAISFPASVGKLSPINGLHSPSALPLLFNYQNAHTWTLQSDGWLTTVHGGHLLWIPPHYSPFALCMPPSILVIGEKCIKFDMSRFVHGTRWTECFDSSP